MKLNNAVGVNPASGYVYVANMSSGDVTVFPGAEVVTTLAAGTYPNAVSVNPATGYVYVANQTGNDVTVLSDTQVLETLPTGHVPLSLAVNNPNQ